MLKHKRIREKGKISFTKYFQVFNAGDKVAVVKDMSFVTGFSNRMQGRTGTVLEKRGAAYVIEIPDGGMKKQLMIKPIHLKKLNAK